MKYVKYVLIVIVSLYFQQNVQAKGAKEKPLTDTIQVSGNCGMCKKTIEKTVKVKGVKKASWSQESHELIVTYLPSKISNDKIQQLISGVGYDTEKYKAEEKVYKNLHPCCQYQR